VFGKQDSRQRVPLTTSEDDDETILQSADALLSMLTVCRRLS